MYVICPAHCCLTAIQRLRLNFELYLISAFSALILLIGRRAFGLCRLFAYSPTDATAIPKPRHLLPHLNPDWFLPFWTGTGLPRLSWKRGH